MSPKKINRNGDTLVENVSDTTTETASETLPATRKTPEMFKNPLAGRKIALPKEQVLAIKKQALEQDPWNLTKFEKGEHRLSLLLKDELVVSKEGTKDEREFYILTFADLETGGMFRTSMSIRQQGQLTEMAPIEEQRILSMYYGGKVKTRSGFECHDWKILPMSAEQSANLLSQMVEVDNTAPSAAPATAEATK